MWVTYYLKSINMLISLSISKIISGSLGSEHTNYIIEKFHLSPNYILKNRLTHPPLLNLKHFDWLIHDDMEF